MTLCTMMVHFSCAVHCLFRSKGARENELDAESEWGSSLRLISLVERRTAIASVFMYVIRKIKVLPKD